MLQANFIDGLMASSRNPCYNTSVCSIIFLVDLICNLPIQSIAHSYRADVVKTIHPIQFKHRVSKQRKSRWRKWRGWSPLFGLASRDGPPSNPPLDIKRKKSNRRSSVRVICYFIKTKTQFRENARSYFRSCWPSWCPNG